MSPLPSWADWTRGPHRMSIQATSLLAGETSCNSASRLAAIAALAAAVQLADSSTPAEAKIRPSSLPRKPVKRQTIFPGASRQRAGNEKAESWDDSKGSTDLIAALISRNSLRIDGTYVRYCMTQIATLRVAKCAHEAQARVICKMRYLIFHSGSVLRSILC